jgi:hypothetical protein
VLAQHHTDPFLGPPDVVGLYPPARAAMFATPATSHDDGRTVLDA